MRLIKTSNYEHKKDNAEYTKPNIGIIKTDTNQSYEQ